MKKIVIEGVNRFKKSLGFIAGTVSDQDIHNYYNHLIDNFNITEFVSSVLDDDGYEDIKTILKSYHIYMKYHLINMTQEDFISLSLEIYKII